MKEAFDIKDDNIVCSVFSELKALGVKVPSVKKFKSGVPKYVKEGSSISGKIFGIPIGQQEKISIDDYVLPKFVLESTSYLKRYSAVEIGLFRKAGSITRQKDLRAKLERGESIENSEPNDVASLLKQWLRELPDPLIPAYLQDLFIRCQKLQIEENRIAALLLCCHLLPFEHLQTLKYLLEFLFEMATNSDKNKMGAHNLALIMAPNIFVWGEHSIDKSSNDLVQLHTSILELLINNVQRIVSSPCSSFHSLDSKSLRNSTDLDLSLDALDYSPSKSKKRRSGPFQGKMSCPLDLFTGIRKLVSQNSTSSPIPSKKGNQDKLVPETAPRSASKRKADPEQLSLSPLKKQATNTRNILQSVGTNFTPDSKCSQNMFANGKEKTGSAHSRRKSFGLLRRKDKKNRQKSSKPIEVLVNKEESKVNTNTSKPFEEHLPTLQKPEEDKSSPLLSTSDIDRILARSTFTKKSVSDCYLTLYDNEYQKRPVFSTSSSEGCLHSNNNSPYNLRSSTSNRKPVKRKSDVLNVVSTTDKENTRQRSSPRLKSISPVAIYSSPQQKSPNPNDATFIIKNNNSRENDNTLFTNDFDVTDSLHSVQKRLNYGEQKTMNLKDTKASFPHKTENPQETYISGNDKTADTNVHNSTATDISLNLPPFNPFIIDNEDKIKRQCSLKRQEAFAVRSKNNKKMNSSQIRRADSIKIANSKSKNLINLESENLSASAKNLNVPLDSPDKRRLKRNVRNGSIVRGRPNTVRTGLPSDLSSKYNNESISTNPQYQITPSTSPTEKVLFTNVVNELKTNDVSTLKSPNITVSTPYVEVISKEIGGKKDFNSSSQITVSLDVRKTKVVSKKKYRERIYSNSDSKMHKMKTRSAKVARIYSFPQNSLKKPEVLRVQELKYMNISNKKSQVKINSPVQNELDKENTPIQNVIKKDNMLVPESPFDTCNDNVFKTPMANFHTPETWFSGREFFESENSKDDDAGNKRESIAMILKNKQGHVQQKVHMYDHRSRSSSTNTPLMTRSARRVESLYDPQYSSMKNKLSEKRCSSVRSNKSLKNKHSPLPPPPKFVLPDSPTTLKPSYPLKELTNISGADNTTLSPSPSKISFISTPNKDSSEKRKKCTLKPKRNSYSGHTPYRLPKDRHKVLRSESSPLLQKTVNKSSQKQLECVKVSPFTAVNDQNSAKSLDGNSRDTLNFKTKSSLSIDKLKLDQLTDEWNCEM